MLEGNLGLFIVMVALLLGPILLFEAFTALRNWLRHPKNAEEAPDPWTYPVTPADPSLPLYNAASEHTGDRGEKLRRRHYRDLERQDRNFYGFHMRRRRHR